MKPNILISWAFRVNTFFGHRGSGGRTIVESGETPLEKSLTVEDLPGKRVSFFICREAGEEVCQVPHIIACANVDAATTSVSSSVLTGIRLMD